MKAKLTILILAIFTSITSFAQEFAPVGATWTYFKYSGTQTIYTQAESEKDTLMNGKQCQKVIISDYNNSCNSKSIKAILFLYQQNDTVWFLQNNTFYPLFFFNVQVGDSIQMPNYTHTSQGLTCDTVKTLVIDSVGVINLNGISRRYYVANTFSTNTNTFESSIKVVENIGVIGDNFFIPHFVCATDMDYYILKCFKDNQGEIIFSTTSCNCMLTTNEDYKKKHVNLFPNPTADFIHLQLENTKNVNYRITDITGKVMAQNTWNGQAISVENLNSGVYFITLLNKNEILGTQKIIKQ